MPFTRNLAGPMDFTPVTFSGVRPSSDAAELGLGVLYLRAVSAAWDETWLVAGAPGTLAVLARRSGSTWFLGAGVAGDPRDLSVPTGFLGSGSWLVELYHDGPTGKIAFDTKRVAAGDSFVVPVGRNGGYAARLCQVPVGVQSCG